jgi:hypothetical protein
VEEGSGHIETGNGHGNLRWAWSLILVVGAVDWIWADRIGMVFTGWLHLALMLVALLAVGVLYGYSGRDLRLSDAGTYAALWTAFSIAGVVLTYLAATLALPLRDADFVAVDAAMGFHWLAWSGFIRAHHAIELPLFIAYATFLPQIVGSILYFAHTRQTSRNAELLWIGMLALILTTIVSGLLPAVGPYVHFYGRQTDDIAALMNLRAGGPHTYDFGELKGIITLPSFHTVLAIAFIYVHRPPSRSFVPVAILNLLMLIAIPSEGHHYLIDVVSGAAVVAICLAIVRTVRPSPRLLPSLRDNELQAVSVS